LGWLLGETSRKQAMSRPLGRGTDYGTQLAGGKVAENRFWISNSPKKKKTLDPRGGASPRAGGKWSVMGKGEALIQKEKF